MTRPALFTLSTALLLSACTPLACQHGNTDPDLCPPPHSTVVQPVPFVQCDPKELARYEAKGWDSWECHWDKAALADER